MIQVSERHEPALNWLLDSQSAAYDTFSGTGIEAENGAARLSAA
jgi:hypothetical protein